MSRRSRAREAAFLVLYQDDLNPSGNPAQRDKLLKNRLKADDLVEFARGLVSGVRRHCEEIDNRFREIAENWSVHRMATTDRNVLRLGAYEILYSDEPPQVIINEAVELAKSYGTAQSGSFVNGILDRIMRLRRDADADADADAEQS